MNPEGLDDAEGVSRCTEDHLAELQAFKAQMYESGNQVLDRRRVEWLFLRHPMRPDAGLSIWVWRRHGRIIGTLAEIPFDLRVDDRNLRGSWGIDAMVDPQWRGRGIGPALSEERRRFCRVSAALSVSDAAYRSVLRRRSTDMGGIPMFLRLVDPTAITGWEGVPRLVRYLALPLIAPALWLLDRVDRFRTRRTDLVSIDAFDQRADDLWRDVAVRYRIISCRDSSWLRWRFDECPHRDSYLRYYVVHRHHLIGYVVLRPTTWSGRPALALIDYLAAPDDMSRLLSASLRVARRSGAVAVLCTTLNVQARSTLRRGGFFTRRNQGIRFLAYTSDESLEQIILEPANWFITSADSDLD